MSLLPTERSIHSVGIGNCLPTREADGQGCACAQDPQCCWDQVRQPSRGSGCCSPMLSFTEFFNKHLQGTNHSRHQGIRMDKAERPCLQRASTMVAGCGSQTSLLLGQTPVGNSFKVEGRLLTQGFRDLHHGSQKAEREMGGEVG